MMHKKFLGIGTVGERGQVSIPAETRKHCNIKSGEKLAFFSFINKSVFIAVKTDQISKILDRMTQESNQFKNIIRQINKEGK